METKGRRAELGDGYIRQLPMFYKRALMRVLEKRTVHMDDLDTMAVFLFAAVKRAANVAYAQGRAEIEELINS